MVHTSTKWTPQDVFAFLGPLRQECVNNRSWFVTQQQFMEHAVRLVTEADGLAYWHVFNAIQDATQSSPSLDIRHIGILLLCQVYVTSRHKLDHHAKHAEDRATPLSSPRQSPRSSPRGHASLMNNTAGRSRDTMIPHLFFLRNAPLFLKVSAMDFGDDPEVTAEALDQLSAVLSAGPNFYTPYMKVSEACPHLQGRRSAAVSQIHGWIEGALAHNDVLYPPETIFREVPDRNADIVMNLSRATMFRHQRDIPNVTHLSITSCSDSVIYIAAHVPYVHVVSCVDCKIVIAAVSQIASLQHCERVSVHVATSVFKLDNCVDCKAYVYCRTPPILTGDTRGIHLGPFNVVYSELQSLLAQARLPLEEQHTSTWAYPVCATLGMGASMQGKSGFGAQGGPDNDYTTYQVINPEVWLPTSIPEEHKAQAHLVLPQLYWDAYAEHIREVQSLLAQLASLDEPAKQRAQSITQGYFRDWLAHTGKTRQLVDLARMEKAGLR
jgi:hypothetical protein